MTLDTPYLSAVLPLLPPGLETNIHALINDQSPSRASQTLDDLIRFLTGGGPSSHPVHSSDQAKWHEKQKQALQNIQNIPSHPPAHSSSNGLAMAFKRPREDEGASGNGVVYTDGAAMNVDSPSSHKRIRLQEDGSPSQNGPPPSSTLPSSAPTPEHHAPDERPIYVLRSISTTSPVRRKVDIKITASSIQFINPSTEKLEASVPRSLLRRAFLLPTRGKPKPHWTVVIISSDSPGAVAAATRGTSTGTAAQQQQENNPQVIFGIDATATSTTNATAYNEQQVATQKSIGKGEPTESVLRAFLSHLPEVQLLEPTSSVFKSACAQSPGGGGVPGIEAYRQAKVGSLWFMREGILWGEGKPCEFWSVEDLVGRNEGVRILSATGRTCSVFLTRKSGSGVNEGIGDSGAGAKEKGKAKAAGEEDEEDLGIETEFGMIDGREQDPINRWVKEHRHLFGRQAGEENDDVPSATTALDKGKGKAVDYEDIKGKGKGKEKMKEKPTWSGPITINQLPDEDDDDDEDFIGSSSDDSSGSDSDSEGGSGSGSDSDEAASEDVGSGESSDEDEDDEDGDGEGVVVDGRGDGEVDDEELDEEEGDLDPARHPLMRPGAMPKMSRAALAMAVGIVEQDFLGGKAPGANRDAEGDDDSEEDEEDELDE